MKYLLENNAEGQKDRDKMTFLLSVINKVGLRVLAAAAAAKSLQSCPTLCDPIDGSPPVSPVPGILQARILEWVAISFSGDLPNPGIGLRSLTSPALAGGFLAISATREAQNIHPGEELLYHAVALHTHVF